MATVTRHWYLDWDGPRPERDVLAATEVVQRDQEAAEREAAARHQTAASVDVDGAAAQDGVAIEEEEPDPAGALQPGSSGDRS